MEQSPELQNEANMELQFLKVPFEAGYKQKSLFGLDISPPLIRTLFYKTSLQSFLVFRCFEFSDVLSFL